MSEKLVKDLKSTNLQKPYGYIYKTTNLINGKIYIGQHASSNFNNKYKGSGNILKNALKKYGKENFECCPLCWCWTQKELDQKEIDFIAYYKSRDPKIGYNLLSGGYQQGHHHLETRKKLSKTHLNFCKAKRSKIVDASKKVTTKKIICLQNLKIYESLTQAALELNLKLTSISSVLRKVELHAKGYSFEFFDPNKTYKKQAYVSNQRKQKIICLQTLEVSETVKDFAKKYSLKETNISSVLKGKLKHIKGYTFEYFDPSKIYQKQDFIKKRIQRKIICLQNLKTYPSIKAAEKDLQINNIYKVLKAEIQHTKGYTFEYFDFSKTYQKQDFVECTKKQYCFKGETQRKTKNSKLQKIICLQTLEIFNSIKDVEKKMSLQHVSEVLNKQRKSDKGYSFELWDETKTYKIHSFAKKDICQKTTRPKQSKKVLCIENAKIYKSIQEAAKDLNILSSTISSFLRKKGFTASGYTFEFID